MSSNREFSVVLTVVLIFAVAGVLFGFSYLNSETSTTFVVENTERIDNDSGGYYLIFTEDEVLANKDSIVFTKWNSSDVQADMVEGVYCEATVAGWRIPFFSMYRNVIEATCSEGKVNG